jgi:hypothetical protein
MRRTFAAPAPLASTMMAYGVSAIADAFRPMPTQEVLATAAGMRRVMVAVLLLGSRTSSAVTPAAAVLIV